MVRTLFVCYVIFRCISVGNNTNRSIRHALHVFVSPVNLLLFDPLRRVFVGYYPQPELRWVLYNIRTRTHNFCGLFTAFINLPETWNFRTFVPPCHNTRGKGATFVYLPGTCVSSVDFHTRTLNFRKSCNTSIPVPRIHNPAEHNVATIPGFCSACFAKPCCPSCHHALTNGNNSRSSCLIVGLRLLLIRSCTHPPPVPLSKFLARCPVLQMMRSVWKIVGRLNGGGSSHCS